MILKEYDKVITLVEKEGFPPGTTGIIVSFYANSDLWEVELWDEDDYPIDVVNFNLNELEIL